MNDLKDGRDDGRTVYEIAKRDVRAPATIQIDGDLYNVTEWTDGDEEDEYRLIRKNSYPEHKWSLRVKHNTREVIISQDNTLERCWEHVPDISVKTHPQVDARCQHINGVDPLGLDTFQTATEVQS